MVYYDKYHWVIISCTRTVYSDIGILFIFGNSIGWNCLVVGQIFSTVQIDTCRSSWGKICLYNGSYRRLIEWNKWVTDMVKHVKCKYRHVRCNKRREIKKISVILYRY